jgi:hypothetical protein
VSAPYHCEVCDRMDLKKETAVVNVTDLPWFEMFTLKYSVNQMKVLRLLERRNVGRFQKEGRLSSGEVSP